MASRVAPLRPVALVCFVLLVCGSQGRELKQTSLASLFGSLLTRPAATTTTTLPNLGTFTSAATSAAALGGSSSACSGASASSTGGTAVAVSTSSGQSFPAQASACANAASQALTTVCEGGSAMSASIIFAEACAEVVVKLVLNSTAAVATTGSSSACANSCASASAMGSSVSKAIAAAASSTTQGCITGTEGTVTALSAVISNVTANVWASACSSGNAGAAAVAKLTVTSTATALAKAMGAVLAKSCGCPTCKCSGKPTLATEANSASLAEVVDGRYAMAAAVSDAAATVCYEPNKALWPAKIQVATGASLKALAEICVKVLAKYYQDTVTVGPNSIACAGGSVQSDNVLLAEAYGEVFSAAYVMSFDGKCAEAVSAATAMVKSTNMAQIIIDIYQKTCAKKGTSAIAINDIIVEVQNTAPFATATANAFNAVVNTCGCSGCAWCCTTCDWSKTCPGYIKK